MRLVLTLSCAIALAAAPAVARTAAAQAEPTKTATGSITSVGGSSVTVKTSSGDMTFNIDAKTHVISPGGGTKTRAAQAEGKPGAAVTDLLKAGQNVEVKYHQTGMHAASIRTIGSAPSAAKAPAAAAGKESAPPPPPPAPKAKTASGTVSAVAGKSLTVKGASGDMTFSIDEKTTVSGTGIGTAGRKLAAEGAKPTLGEFVKEGDTVSVTYKDVAGSNLASVIRIVRKKP